MRIHLDIRTENNQRDCVGYHFSYVHQGVPDVGAEFFPKFSLKEKSECVYPEKIIRLSILII